LAGLAEEFAAAEGESGRGSLDGTAGIAGEVTEFDLLAEKGEAEFRQGDTSCEAAFSLRRH
jgi:hypothetical protein